MEQDSTLVGVFTGDYGRGGKAYPVHFRDARLLFMAPARLDAVTCARHSHLCWLPEVDALITYLVRADAVCV